MIWRLSVSVLLILAVAGLAAPASAAPPAQTRPTLRPGDRGPYVREAQQGLNLWIRRNPQLGFHLLSVNGVFERWTESTVRAFQRTMDLQRTGIIGPQTWAKLPALNGTAPNRSATPPARRCHPSYPDVCIPGYPPDLDCSDIPYRQFRVLPPDPHRFDRDKDGIGCERNGG